MYNGGDSKVRHYVLIDRDSPYNQGEEMNKGTAVGARTLRLQFYKFEEGLDRKQNIRN